MRARWVAEIARGLRSLTQSLFPPFSIRVAPVRGMSWTDTRLLAGYLLLCIHDGVVVVYAELHAHKEQAAKFIAYENESCETRIVRMEIDTHTVVSERIGVNCSCFSFEGYHFTARSVEEKLLWLRAISNVKVKLKHRSPSPTDEELRHYRQAIMECAKNTILPVGLPKEGPLLPRSSSGKPAPMTPTATKPAEQTTPAPQGPMGKPSSLVPTLYTRSPDVPGTIKLGENLPDPMAFKLHDAAPAAVATAVAAAGAAAAAAAAAAGAPAMGPSLGSPKVNGVGPCLGGPTKGFAPRPTKGPAAHTHLSFKPPGRVEKTADESMPPPPPMPPPRAVVVPTSHISTEDGDSVSNGTANGVASGMANGVSNGTVHDMAKDMANGVANGNGKAAESDLTAFDKCPGDPDVTPGSDGF